MAVINLTQSVDFIMKIKSGCIDYIGINMAKSEEKKYKGTYSLFLWNINMYLMCLKYKQPLE